MNAALVVALLAAMALWVFAGAMARRPSERLRAARRLVREWNRPRVQAVIERGSVR